MEFTGAFVSIFLESAWLISWSSKWSRNLEAKKITEVQDRSNHADRNRWRILRYRTEKDSWGKIKKWTKSYCDKMWAQSEFKRWAIGNWNWVEIENWISNLETEWGAGGTKCGFRHLPLDAEKLDFPLRWLLIHNCCRITGKGMGCKKIGRNRDALLPFECFWRFFVWGPAFQMSLPRDILAMTILVKILPLENS